MALCSSVIAGLIELSDWVLSRGGSVYFIRVTTDCGIADKQRAVCPSIISEQYLIVKQMSVCYEKSDGFLGFVQIWRSRALWKAENETNSSMLLSVCYEKSEKKLADLVLSL